MIDQLLHEAGNMGWDTTATEAFYGTAGLERARRWVEARLANGRNVEQCKAWLERAKVALHA